MTTKIHKVTSPAFCHLSELVYYSDVFQQYYFGEGLHHTNIFTAIASYSRKEVNIYQLQVSKRSRHNTMNVTKQSENAPDSQISREN